MTVRACPATSTLTCPAQPEQSGESETFRLSMDISGAIYDQFLARYEVHGLKFGGEEFKLEDSEPGEPFPLRRVSDGALFEVWLSGRARHSSAPEGETSE